jgi:hypothetical protein
MDFLIIRVARDVSVQLIAADGVAIDYSYPNALFCTTLDVGEGPASRLGCFTPGKNPPVQFGS